MELHGHNIIGQEASTEGQRPFRAVNPATGETLEPAYHDATPVEIDRAMTKAERAFHEYRRKTPEQRAAFLYRISTEIENLGEVLIDRAHAETALPRGRLISERGRTVNQIALFAEAIREGSWVEARIDQAIPDRQPVPRPDLRRMLIPVGPVVVFGSSNFPLAYSVAGGDTGSSLAAGNPVVVKAHPAHPGVSELVARAIQKAVEASAMPDGLFSMLHGASNDIGVALVTHPAARAVGFTGSLGGGRALFDAAATRPNPIPVHAEMGSINPVFVLPGVLEERVDALSKGLANSATLGVGQFCTNPGLVVAGRSEHLDVFVQKMTDLIARAPCGTMLHAGIRAAYDEGVKRFEGTPGVRVAGRSRAQADPGKNEAAAVFFVTDTEAFLQHPWLREEVFGPSTLLVRYGSREELERIVEVLEGQLTASIHGTERDLDEHAWLVASLENLVGRLIMGGFPTGVEVCPAMHHGGPYPATTDARATSVGTAAIQRFARPICYQNCPESLLPPELKNHNHRNVWRLIDNRWTKDHAAPWVPG